LEQCWQLQGSLKDVFSYETEDDLVYYMSFGIVSNCTVASPREHPHVFGSYLLEKTI
jgi:hypothetical protein